MVTVHATTRCIGPRVGKARTTSHTTKACSSVRNRQSTQQRRAERSHASCSSPVGSHIMHHTTPTRTQTTLHTRIICSHSASSFERAHACPPPQRFAAANAQLFALPKPVAANLARTQDARRCRRSNAPRGGDGRRLWLGGRLWVGVGGDGGGGMGADGGGDGCGGDGGGGDGGGGTAVGSTAEDTAAAGGEEGAWTRDGLRQTDKCEG